MHKRLFIAVDLPPAITQELMMVIAHFKCAELFQGRFMRPEQLHVTLKFLGGIDQEKELIIRNKLAAIEQKKCIATLDGLGIFTSHGSAHILYANLISNELELIAGLVNEAVIDVVPREKHPFINHVTLGRINSVTDQAKFLQEVKAYCLEPLNFTVSEFVLKESVQTLHAVEYQDVARYELND